MTAMTVLRSNYQRFAALPWDRTLAGAQKVWFALYDPVDERRLRLHVPEFELATKEIGHTWKAVDLTDSFAHWMGRHEYRDAYFAQPEDMANELQSFAETVAEELRAALTTPDVDANTVVAVIGAASLYGLTSVSQVLETVVPAIRGRLLVFFPGHKDGNIYRLLDARDGWNYLAIPITANEES